MGIAMGVSIAAMIGSSMIARSIPYTPGVGAKQAAWLAHCAVVGAVIAPICLLGGPILTRAAWYTAGMVGGLSTVAVWFSAQALHPTSFHPPLPWGLECIALLCMVDLFCLALSCCTTPRKSSTRQRTTLPTIALLPTTQTTPPSAYTWTPSTSSSGLQ